MLSPRKRTPQPLGKICLGVRAANLVPRNQPFGPKPVEVDPEFGFTDFGDQAPEGKPDGQQCTTRRAYGRGTGWLAKFCGNAVNNASIGTDSANSNSTQAHKR